MDLNMTIKKSKAQLIAKLKKENLVFHEFTLIHEGRYEVADADWNYKDIPHLHFVHELAEAYPSYISDETIASIIIQKILGIKIPLAVFLFENSPTSQLYYTASFFFVLLIETVYEKLGTNNTRVKTTYSIGASRFFKWTFKILEWLIKRNYDNLMSTDIPMRERRGQLRDWGYELYNENATYSYKKSLNLTSKNVIPPLFNQHVNKTCLNISQILPVDGEYLLGQDDAWGLRIVKEKEHVKIYPRMCHHEGASLDKQRCQNNKIKCPWHGTIIGVIADFDISASQQQISESRFHHICFQANTLEILFLDNYLNHSKLENSNNKVQSEVI
jgi:hypothetical protein